MTIFFLGYLGLPTLLILSVFSTGWGYFINMVDRHLLLTRIVILTFFLCMINSGGLRPFIFLTCLFSLLFFLTDRQIIIYIFFEAAIFPVIVIIVFFGNTFERFESTYYLITFRALRSYPILVGMVGVGGPHLISINFFLSSMWALVFIIAFIVKLPLYLVHYWLPKAHVEAPTIGRMILAGILLKLGGWGVVRMMNFFSYSWFFSVVIFIMIAGSILAPIWAVTHRDGKGLVAFSSISHINFSGITVIIGATIRKTSGVLVFLTHDLISCIIF